MIDQMAKGRQPVVTRGLSGIGCVGWRKAAIDQNTRTPVGVDQEGWNADDPLPAPHREEAAVKHGQAGNAVALQRVRVVMSPSGHLAPKVARLDIGKQWSWCKAKGGGRNGDARVVAWRHRCAIAANRAIPGRQAWPGADRAGLPTEDGGHRHLARGNP